MWPSLLHTGFTFLLFSAHPYIFFNWDRFSITFVGFKVSPDRRILDPDGRTIEVARMSKQLLAGLKHNKVNFAEDYRQWNKLKMIEKIRTVLGLDLVSDPDPTYVLTPDNLVKILAIHMRFRYSIIMQNKYYEMLNLCVCSDATFRW